MTDAKNAAGDDPDVGAGFDQTNGLVDGLEGDDGGAQNDGSTAGGGVLGTVLADLEDRETGTSTYDTSRGDAGSGAGAGSDGYVEPVDDGAERGYSEEGRP